MKSRIITCIIFGVVSVFVYVGKQIESFCKREFAAALIIGTITVAIIAGWMGTFITERSARVTAEYQRDSLAMKLDSAKQYSRGLDQQASDLLINNHWNGNK